MKTQNTSNNLVEMIIITIYCKHVICDKAIPLSFILPAIFGETLCQGGQLNLSKISNFQHCE